MVPKFWLQCARAHALVDILHRSISRPCQGPLEEFLSCQDRAATRPCADHPVVSDSIPKPGRSSTQVQSLAQSGLPSSVTWHLWPWPMHTVCPSSVRPTLRSGGHLRWPLPPDQPAGEPGLHLPHSSVSDRGSPGRSSLKVFLPQTWEAPKIIPPPTRPTD